MDSLKALSILTTFDTLYDDDQRELSMNLILRAWGLCKEIVGFMTAEAKHPLANMTWLHEVCGDISLNEWQSAIASYQKLNIKSARMYCNTDGSDKHVYLYRTDRVPQYAKSTSNWPDPTETMEEYETFDQLIKNCNSATWWFDLEDDRGYDYLKDKLMR